MNNAIATTIRNAGISTVFPNGVPSDFIQTDTGKFVFSVGDGKWCGISFTSKTEDYTPDYEVKKFTEKCNAQREREAEKQAKLAEKAKKQAEKAEKSPKNAE